VARASLKTPKVLDGTVALARMSRRTDEALIAQLTTVRGIGPRSLDVL
jgi:hypothetical protein